MALVISAAGFCFLISWVGVYVTGWLVTETGSYAAPFMLCAAVEVLGAVVWLSWGTAKRIVD